MKNKIITSIVLLFAGIACQAPSQPKQPDANYDPLPDKCPILKLQQKIPAVCCYALCASRYPGTAYISCREQVLEGYNCTSNQKTVIYNSAPYCQCR